MKLKKRADEKTFLPTRPCLTCLGSMAFFFLVFSHFCVYKFFNILNLHKKNNQLRLFFLSDVYFYAIFV